MAYPVEFTDEFGEWWDGLIPAEQKSVERKIVVLEQDGPNLKRPIADTIRGSMFPNMRAGM